MMGNFVTAKTYSKITLAFLVVAMVGFGVFWLGGWALGSAAISSYVYSYND